MKQKREHYIIDGYNVINSWPELNCLLDELSFARARLEHILTDYGAYERFDITIVYDASFTLDDEHQEKLSDHVSVIYTGAGGTADSCIERLAYESVRRGREVHVVTSDSAEQFVILGAGAYRISAREFRRTVRKARQKLETEYLSHVKLPVVRNEVGSRIDSATAKQLDELRKER